MSGSRTTELHEVCGDDRFDLIAKAREKLLDSTNIESRQEEVDVLDSILFRFWQMGWLDQLRDDAATLGSELNPDGLPIGLTISDDGTLLNWRGENYVRQGVGTLTAEQVREAIEHNFGKVAVLDDGGPVEWRDDWVCKVGINYKAIAEELNAEMGSGTCEQVLTDCDDGLMPPFTAHCSACGAEWGFTPRYCHNCGAKCAGTRDERKAVER